MCRYLENGICIIDLLEQVILREAGFSLVIGKHPSCMKKAYFLFDMRVM